MSICRDGARVDCICREDRVPAYARPGDAGADLRASLDEPVEIAPGRSQWVPTGVAVGIPAGHVGLLFPRSGLACKHGICLANGVGVIDSGYRGEIRAKLLNLGDGAYTVTPGDRICQLVIVPFTTALFECVDALDGTERGSGGFGSTGCQ